MGTRLSLPRAESTTPLSVVRPIMASSFPWLTQAQVLILSAKLHTKLVGVVSKASIRPKINFNKTYSHPQTHHIDHPRYFVHCRETGKKAQIRLAVEVATPWGWNHPPQQLVDPQLCAPRLRTIRLSWKDLVDSKISTVAKKSLNTPEIAT